MRTIELKIARIGNSRGVQLPANTLRRYGIRDAVLMEERVDGLFLHPRKSANAKLSWEETAKQMAASQEEWNDWDVTASDGVDGIRWVRPNAVVAERRASYRAGQAKKRGGRAVEPAS
jgi:antitoxin component of MazEF toxin-antitoxin module